MGNTLAIVEHRGSLFIPWCAHRKAPLAGNERVIGHLVKANGTASWRASPAWSRSVYQCGGSGRLTGHSEIAPGNRRLRVCAIPCGARTRVVGCRCLGWSDAATSQNSLPIWRLNADVSGPRLHRAARQPRPRFGHFTTNLSFLRNRLARRRPTRAALQRFI